MNRTLFHAVLIIVLGLITYSNTFHVPFQFDDPPVIKQSASLLKTFSLSAFLKENRSVGYLSFALNHAVHGLSVEGYHVVNIAIHLTNALLLYMLVMLSFRTPLLIDTMRKNRAGAIALLASLLFVCHPVQTQAVTYIAQRFASLAAMFYLLSLVLYIQARRSGRQACGPASYVLSLLCAVLAMKTKEIAFTLPFVIVLYETMFFQGSGWRRLVFPGPYLLMLLLVPLGFLGAYGFDQDILRDVEMTTRVQTTISRYSYLFTEFRVVATYLRLLLLPINQDLDYDYPIYHMLSEPGVVSALLVILVMVFAAWRFRSSTGAVRLLSFGIFWFFITLSIESGVVPIEDVIFEHRLYLPSAGFFIALAASLVVTASKLEDVNKRSRNVVTGMIVVVLLMLSAAAFTRNTVWHTETALWKDVTEKSPLKERGHYNLARQYRIGGQSKKAVAEYELAIAYSRNAIDSSDAYNNLGRLYEGRGLMKEAEAAYQKSVELNQANSIALNNLGLIFMLRNLPDEAIAQFRHSIAYDPAYAKAHANLGRALEMKGLHEESQKELQNAAELGFDAAKEQTGDINAQ